MSNASTRGSQRLATALAATIFALSFLTPTLFTAAPASAHAHLVKSFPDAGAVLAASPPEVVLTFDQPIQAFPGANGIVVTGPQSSHWACGRARIDGNTLTASMSELGAPGRYRIDYRVLGADGHPIIGSVPINIRRSASTASTASTTSATSIASTASAATAMTAFDVDRPRGLAALPTWLWIALLAAIAACVGAIGRQTVRRTDAT
ncbi:copper resistance CopC family protein [Nocardioides sp. NPDC127514]|uniref:copper resistance CopC family protein n=1 Tax=unclassified Nocardioides TaxID=2615069 RepID=UPI003330A2C5